MRYCTVERVFNFSFCISLLLVLGKEESKTKKKMKEELVWFYSKRLFFSEDVYYIINYYPSLGPAGPVGLLPTLMSVCVCVCVSLSTGVVPMAIKPLASWRDHVPVPLADRQV